MKHLAIGLVFLAGCLPDPPYIAPECEAGGVPVDASDATVSHPEAGPREAGGEAGAVDATIEAGPVDAGDYDGNVQALFNVFPPGDFGVAYLGGSILGRATVYLLWYGNWDGSPAPAILEDMLHSVSGDDYHDASAYYGILWNYSAQFADSGILYTTPPRVRFGGSYYLGYTAGKYLGLGNEENQVGNAITYGVVPYDQDGIYVILTSADVGEDLGFEDAFCLTYCGFHRLGATNDTLHKPFRYAFAGSPDRCPDDCTMKPEWLTAGADASPNGDWASDGLASLVVHEIFETITDPAPYTGWVSPFQSEIGDLCAWRFDPVWYTDAGSVANVHWGDRDYLIQQMWTLDDAGGHCSIGE